MNAASSTFQQLYNCLNQSCSTECGAHPRADCQRCLESKCGFLLQACVVERPLPPQLLACAEWLACMTWCKGSTTPGACVAACDNSLAAASKGTAGTLKSCGMANGCRGCVDTALGTCDTNTLLGCLQNNCSIALNACWADYT